MPCKDSQETELPNPLAALLAVGQMCVTVGADAFIVPLERIRREGCWAERADILRLFSGESAVTHSRFRMRYEAERDRVHFNRISQPSSPPSQVVAAQALPPVAVLDLTQKADSSMSMEQLTASAKREWETDRKLHREFTSESVYVAFRKAEITGRARIFGRTKVGGRH